MSVVIQRADAEPRPEPRPEPRGAPRADSAAENLRPAGRRKPETARGAGRSVFATALVLITVAAVYGQIGYGIDHYTPGSVLNYLPEGAAHLVARLIVAVVIALAIESIANFVQYKAHEARLDRDPARAAMLSRSAYIIAGFVAFINYQHFCADGLAPTPAALVFAALSFLSPWLWSLRTRADEHKQRAADGTLDRAGAKFAAERWRQFPILTWRARRYSVMYNHTDPHEAWNAFMAEYRGEVVRSSIERRQRRDERPAGGLLGRWGGVTGGAKPGVTGGATAGVNRGATSTPQGGATAGAVPGAADTTPPTGRPTVTTMVRHTAPDERAALWAALTPNEQTALWNAAVDWAAEQTVKTRSLIGWRSISNAQSDRTGALLFPALSESPAKRAAREAQTRVAGAPARAAR